MEEERATDFLDDPSGPQPHSPPPLRQAPSKGVKRPRPSAVSSVGEDDSELPDLAEFQATFELTDTEMIKLCTAFATYLKAVHRRGR